MRRLSLVTAAALLFAASTAGASPILLNTYAGTGAGATTARDDFRTAIGGGVVAGANGSFGGVRREINWDGVPDASSAPNNLAANFFNVNSPRGVVFSTPGTGFQVSATAASGTSVEFGNIEPSYTSTFAAFSAQRLFTALGSNIVDVSFFLAGTNTPALTSAFGSIFTDVDLANTTSLQFFDASNASLGIFFVPAVAGSDETVSFLGARFSEAGISRVRITNGNAALGAGVRDSNGNPTDLVVMDDFVYAEPTAAAVPEPATLLLTGGGLVALAKRRRRARA